MAEAASSSLFSGTDALIRDDLAGVVLAGGASTRFGANKLLLDIDGETMLDRVVRALKPLVSATYLSVSDDHAAYESASLPILKDLEPGLGPMAGIKSAITLLPHEAFLVVAGDMPAIGEQHLATLIESATREADAIVAVDSAGRWHPLVGIYRRRVLPAILESERSGNFAMHHLISLIKKVQRVTFPDDALINVNRPEDLAGLKQR